MNMNNCENCKHWQHPSDLDKAPLWDGHGTCGKIDTYDFYEKYENPKPEAICIDSSDYIGVLFTKNTFSCSLFEPK